MHSLRFFCLLVCLALYSQALRDDLNHILDGWTAPTCLVLAGVGEHTQAEGAANRQRVRARSRSLSITSLADTRRPLFFFFPELRAPCATTE